MLSPINLLQPTCSIFARTICECSQKGNTWPSFRRELFVQFTRSTPVLSCIPRSNEKRPFFSPFLILDPLLVIPVGKAAQTCKGMIWPIPCVSASSTTILFPLPHPLFSLAISHCQPTSIPCGRASHPQDLQEFSAPPISMRLSQSAGFHFGIKAGNLTQSHDKSGYITD